MFEGKNMLLSSMISPGLRQDPTLNWRLVARRSRLACTPPDIARDKSALTGFKLELSQERLAMLLTRQISKMWRLEPLA